MFVKKIKKKKNYFINFIKSLIDYGEFIFNGILLQTAFQLNNYGY